MKKIKLFLIIALFSSFQARSDEGMWLLPLLEKLNIGTMTEMGLKLSAEDIYSLNHASIKDAVVIFGGGCTGEIISEKGLVLTNHHCGFRSIQALSSVENDYLNDGYFAMSQDEEIPAPGLMVHFLVEFRDVTKEVLADINESMSEQERAQKIRTVSNQIAAKTMEGNNYRAAVQDFFGGNNYYLVVYESYRDVRLVGTPPQSIGKFGGDTDNFEWPRHTGDFSMFRVYMSPDGKPAEYSENNVPLKPKKFLPISIKGVKEGDFTMILGFPGGTQSYLTSYGIDDILNVSYPPSIKLRGIKQDIWLEDMLADNKVRLQYASKYAGSANGWKLFRGVSEALVRLDVKTEKQEIEARYLDWISEKPTERAKFKEALDLIKEAYDARKEIFYASAYTREALGRGIELLGMAGRAGALTRALESDDEEGTKKAIERMKSMLDGMYKDYNMPTDKKVALAMLQNFVKDVPESYHPDYIIELNKKYKGDFSKYVDQLFDKSIFSSKENFLAFLDHPKLKKLEKDPAYLLRESIQNKSREFAVQLAPIAEKLNKGQRVFIAGRLAMEPDKAFYPDANFTMRLNYGKVGGYTAKDAVEMTYYTTLKGVMEKEIPGHFEFDVPQKLKDLYEKKDYGRYANEKGELQLCFLSDNHSTGGNSGSPVLDGEGNLIGLLFDGNWEGISGDIAFDEELCKTINVDIRYVLFLIDKFAGASYLFEEMDIKE